MREESIRSLHPPSCTQHICAEPETLSTSDSTTSFKEQSTSKHDSAPRKNIAMFFLHPFLKVLDILLALVAIYLAVYYAFNVTTAGILTPALATICSIPGASFLEICPGQLPKPSAQALPTAELNFTTRLEQLQLISAKSVDLPYHLQASEGAIGDMIVQLSAVHLPSRSKPRESLLILAD